MFLQIKETCVALEHSNNQKEPVRLVYLHSDEVFEVIDFYVYKGNLSAYNGDKIPIVNLIIMFDNTEPNDDIEIELSLPPTCKYELLNINQENDLYVDNYYPEIFSKKKVLIRSQNLQKFTDIQEAEINTLNYKYFMNLKTLMNVYIYNT